MPFKNGDLVWAKMKGFPPWPGLVSHPPDGLMEGTLSNDDLNHLCVYFFGTHNYGFIDQKQLKAYLPHREEMRKMCKSTKFKKACSEIEEFYKKIETPVTELEDIGNIYPTIKLHKIEDFLPLADLSENENQVMRSVNKPAKKRKFTNFSDPDTTTLLDSTCQSLSSSSDVLSKGETSLQGSDEHSGEEEEQEGEEHHNDSADEATDTSSGETTPSPNRYGFIGLGVMGKSIVQKLVKDGHELVVWNRTPEKVSDIENIGVKIANSPGEVVSLSNIIFCCVSDGFAVKHVLFGNGVLGGLTPEKGFVDLSSTDVPSSKDMAEIICGVGSRYLEIRIHGSKKEAEEGSLLCLAAGDKSLNFDCQFFYQSICHRSFFMGDAGNASKIHLIVQSLVGVTLAGLAECMALADRAGLDQADLLNILELSQLNSPLIVEKASAMVRGDYSPSLSLRNMQTIMQNVIQVGEELEQPTPVAATAKEIFKHAQKVGYGGHDVSAVFLGFKF